MAQAYREGRKAEKWGGHMKRFSGFGFPLLGQCFSLLLG